MIEIILPLQRLFSEEISFAECSNKVFLTSFRTNGDLYLALGDDEECVASSTLSDDIIALLVVALFQHIGYFAQSVFGEVFEDWDAKRRK